MIYPIFKLHQTLQKRVHTLLIYIKRIISINGICEYSTNVTRILRQGWIFLPEFVSQTNDNLQERVTPLGVILMHPRFNHAMMCMIFFVSNALQTTNEIFWLYDLCLKVLTQCELLWLFLRQYIAPIILTIFVAHLTY